MAQFECVSSWEVNGLTKVLAECGMPEGHPWFTNIMQVGAHFCGVIHGVDSVSEMVDHGLSAKFLKAVKAEFPEFPKAKQKKLREVLNEMRPQRNIALSLVTTSDESSVSSANSKRGRKSKFSDDAEIEWVTKTNPHKFASDRWCMWEVAFESNNRGEFLSKEGMWNKVKDERRPAPHSGYFSYLVNAGHIIIN